MFMNVFLKYEQALIKKEDSFSLKMGIVMCGIIKNELHKIKLFGKE